jgi:glycosyltransferase involved in cell wall biosynthesis
MNLAVNARFLSQPTCGPQRFAASLCREIKKLRPETRFLAPPEIRQPELAEELEVEIIAEAKFRKRQRLKLPAGILWEQLDLPARLRASGRPWLLSPANQAPLSYAGNFIVIHDLAFHLYPEFFTRRFALYYNLTIPRLARRARHLFTVSRFSRETLVAHLGLDEKKITLVPNAVADNFLAPPDDAAPLPLPLPPESRFILCVGSLEPRKNLARLVAAFRKLKSENLYLVIAGGENREVFRRIPELEQGNNIIFTGHLDDRTLAALYRKAEIFVYPSLFEGFGLPPLEAQAAGCPVLVAEAGALPEIFAGSALFCDPDEVNDIAARMTQLLDDDRLKERLVEAGRKNAARFSWPESARIVIETIGQNG